MKNPDFLFRNPDFLLKNDDLIITIKGTFSFSFYLHDATLEGMAATKPFVAAACFMGTVALGAPAIFFLAIQLVHFET